METGKNREESMELIFGVPHRPIAERQWRQKLVFFLFGEDYDVPHRPIAERQWRLLPVDRILEIPGVPTNQSPKGNGD